MSDYTNILRCGQAWAFFCGVVTTHAILWSSPNHNPWMSIAIAGLIVVAALVIAALSPKSKEPTP